MSLFPLIQHPFSRQMWWDVDFPSPSRIFDQHFGLTLTDDDLFPPQLFHGFYLRPRRGLARSESGMSEVTNEKDNFKVNLEVKHFKPEELSVKVVGDSVVVSGKHEERSDEHGYVSRQFVRRYVLPPGSKPEDVTSELSGEGLLQIMAPKQAPEEPTSNERIIPITRLEQPAVTDKKPEAKL